ncbi:hypothetical protein D3C84_1204230 [compost metagenome]
MVKTTHSTTPATGCQPSATTWAKVMRKPSSATPSRRMVDAVNAMPGTQGPSMDRKFIAIPRRSAKSITGAP